MADDSMRQLAADFLVRDLDGLAGRGLANEYCSVGQVAAIVQKTRLALNTDIEQLAKRLNVVGALLRNAAFQEKLQKRVRAQSDALQNLINVLKPALQGVQNIEANGVVAEALSWQIQINQPRRSVMKLSDLGTISPEATSECAVRVGAAQREIKEILSLVEQCKAGLNTQFKSSKPTEWNMRFLGEVLPLLYEFHFQVRFAISRHAGSGAPTGPGVRFLTESVSALGILLDTGKPPSAETLVQYWKKARQNPLFATLPEILLEQMNGTVGDIRESNTINGADDPK